MSNNTVTEEQLASSPPNELAPIPISDRLGVMDSIRGFALIGILMMNIEWFSRPISALGSFDTTLNGGDHAVSWFVKAFIEGKFYKLFALLFGMGFAVMLIKAQQAQRPFNAMFIRRMAALFVFGLIHYFFFWGGDILHDYAFAGLVLLGWVQLVQTKRFKHLSKPAFFLRLGLSILFIPMTIMIIVATGIGMIKDNQNRVEHWEERKAVVSQYYELYDAHKLDLIDEIPEEGIENTTKEYNDPIETEDETETTSDADEVDVDLINKEERIAYKANLIFERKVKREKEMLREANAMKGDSFFSGVKYRSSGIIKLLAQTIGGGIFMFFPIFLIGYWLIASGVINNADKYAQEFKIMAWVGTLSGLGITMASLHIIQAPVAIETIYVINSAQTLFIFSQLLVTAGYLGIIVTLYQIPKWQLRLNRLAPLGRMALTNYLMQSVILSFVFYGYGLGMFGEISRAPQMLIVVVIIAVQLIFSTLWLKHFRFGPLEWLWRCITYLKIQPMKL